MGKLTALKVRRAKPGRHGDGGGLYLVVSDTGARKWVLRIQNNGKRHDLGLGSANDVPLAEAREVASDIRRAVRNSKSPLAVRRGSPQAIPTFREVANMVHEEHSPSWKNPKHAAQWITTLETYAYRSPYMKLMLAAEMKFGSRLTPCPEHAMTKEIAYWLHEHWPEFIDGPVSENRINQMAGLIRHPDLGKGGNRRTR